MKPASSTLVEEFRYSERCLLTPGTIFRVSKGPYYVDQTGQHISMADKGKFKFWRYDPRGFILANRIDGADVGGLSVLHVGRTYKSKLVEGMVVRGYAIRRPLSEREPCDAKSTTTRSKHKRTTPAASAGQTDTKPKPEATKSSGEGSNKTRRKGSLKCKRTRRSAAKKQSEATDTI